VQHHNQSGIEHRGYGTGTVRYLALHVCHPELLKNTFRIFSEPRKETVNIGETPGFVIKRHCMFKNGSGVKMRLNTPAIS